MMRITRRFGLIVLSLVALGATGFARAACPGATIAAPGNCLYAAGFSTVGGDLVTATQRVLASNMDPFQRQGAEADLAYWKDTADAGLTAGKNFRDGLLLTGATANDGTDRGKMLNDPRLNYQSLGFHLLDNLPNAEASLLSARDAYAYLLYRHYPSDDSARANLLDTIKTLANIYLMIADEFLIDALEWRFSSDILNMDGKLDEQIGLLQSAQGYYQKAIDVFVSGFSPAVGTNLWVSSQFDDAVFSLFDTTVERLSMTLRELSSKRLVRQMAPDPAQDWTAARKDALTALKSANTATYLTAAAIAKTQGEVFDTAGGGGVIAGALAALRNQANALILGLNPLGYDKRYVPMLDFDPLHSLATSGVADTRTAEATLTDEKRLFDSQQNALEQQLNALIDRYVQSLTALTGCKQPSVFTDPTQSQALIDCTGAAGPDLFACRLAMSSTDFETCLAGKTTGTLAQRHRQVLTAHTRLAEAMRQRDNYFARIDIENQRAGAQIGIKRSFAGAQAVTLDHYYSELKKARTITDTEQKTTKRERKNGKWVITAVTRDHMTTTSFAISDGKLGLEAAKERELLEKSTDYEIQGINADSAATVKNLLLSAAAAEDAIQLAVQQKSSAIADFDNVLQEKENLWQLYQRGLKQLNDAAERSAPSRIIMSAAAIDLSRHLNNTTRYIYLAAKALEYQHLQPLTSEYRDLFRAQTADDLGDVLGSLKAKATTGCAWGNVAHRTVMISLAKHILGLTNGYLDPDGDGMTTDGKTVVQARKELLQAYIHQNKNLKGNFEFSFIIPEGAPYFSGFNWFNQKLWAGQAPTGCDAFGNSQLGVAVNVVTSQTGKINPLVRLKQAGHSTLRDAAGQFFEYIPVNDRYFVISDEWQASYKDYRERTWSAFFNTDPATQSGERWTDAFKGRSIVSPGWDMELIDGDLSDAQKMDLSKITDVSIYMDIIGE